MKKTLFIFSIYLFVACVTDDDKAKINGANQFVSGIEKFEKYDKSLKYSNYLIFF